MINSPGAPLMTCADVSVHQFLFFRINRKFNFAISIKWWIIKIQMSYQKVYNFITYPNMQLSHANEFLKLKFKCEMQIICELFKF